MNTFQEILRKLSLFWEKHGCVIHQGYDLEVGAGTFNPATFLRCLGPEPYKAAYIEPSRRPTDGRYGTNPNRLQHYFQYQVLLKPSPPDIQELYLKSLEAIGFNLKDHDIRFVHDDWESPTLAAWGLGWEVWMDGMEITQFTYFQCVGGVNLKPVSGEITYGIERLAMYLQKVNSVYDLRWNEELKYGDIYHRNEVEWSHYNFEKASTEMWFRHFDDYEREAKKLIALNLPLPAYDFVMKASHAFNLLDARSAISVTERTGYIARVRELAVMIAQSYVKSREEQAFPLINRFQSHVIEKKEIEAKIPEALLHASPEEREDFILEVGSEELPATFVSIGCRNLEKSIKQFLEKEGILFHSIKSMGTPRRIAIYIKGLSLNKPAQIIEKRGPSLDQAFSPEGQLKPAGEGFFRSLGIPPLSLDQVRSANNGLVEIKELKGTPYLFGTLHLPGQPTAKLLTEQLPHLILNLEFPKKMRWGNLDISYARPLRWLLALFGPHLLPFSVGDLNSGRHSFGHRQLMPKSFEIEKAQDYVQDLKDHFVMVDMKEREQEIIKQLDLLEEKLASKIISRDRVIPQVLNLTEWPQATSSTFDQAFLKIPKEVLISEMVEHQKYFPVADQQENLRPLFIITADTNPTDEIREGNQKVLSARLSDGVFLYEQGLKTPFEELNEKLKHVTFQKTLGSVFDKVKRIVAHVETIQKTLNIGDSAKAKRAALLCKADLASEMVYEFPELQGTIGKYYALKSGEDPEVAQAIEEHWMPRGENAPLPSSTSGILVSLGEKIDNLIGCFCANLKPTSSSDPYALRRQTLGIIKILIAGKHRLPLKKVFDECFDHFPAELTKEKENLLEEIKTFMINRMKTVFLDDAYCKVNSLHLFRKSNSNFPLLYEVYKRAKGQLALAKTPKDVKFNPALLQEEAEKLLDKELNAIQEEFEVAMKTFNYDKAYEIIAGLQPALANLFDQVKILADDAALQNNRVILLRRVFALFDRLLDFSKISEK